MASPSRPPPPHTRTHPLARVQVGQRPAAFPFFYIEPSRKDFLPITAKFTGPITRKEAERIAPIGVRGEAGVLCLCGQQGMQRRHATSAHLPYIHPLAWAPALCPAGNAPTMMAFEDMKKVFPTWFNLSIAIHTDPEAVKEWGWVQEMYAFTLACYKEGIRDIDLHLKVGGRAGNGRGVGGRQGGARP